MVLGLGFGVRDFLNGFAKAPRKRILGDCLQIGGWKGIVTC